LMEVHRRIMKKRRREEWRKGYEAKIMDNFVQVDLTYNLLNISLNYPQIISTKKCLLLSE
jgi:hypothetical protein